MRNTFPSVFVSAISMSYSGSTLLGLLLQTHPQIATVGEMNGPNPAHVDLNEYLCSCGQRIRECGFWQTVGSRMHNKGFEFDIAHFDTRFIPSGHPLSARLRMGSLGNNTLETIRDAFFQAWPGQALQLNKLVARNVAFIEAVLDVTGKNVFVDTSKSPWRFKYLFKFSALDVRVIHLVRDVRGVVASQLRRAKTGSARDAAQLWVKRNKGIQRLLKTLPEDRHIVVRYEDLCRDTQGTLKRLHSFLGVNSDSESYITDFYSIPHHIIGNTMRMKNTSEIKLDERWRSMLTKEQLKEIDKTAGVLSSQYSYPPLLD